MRYRITAPVRKFAGEVAGVAFVDGRAEADEAVHARALEYFRRKGYDVAPVDPVPSVGLAETSGRAEQEGGTDTPPPPSHLSEPKTKTTSRRSSGKTTKETTP